MTRLLIALLAAALLVAGCGGDDDDNADATDAATTAQTQPQTTPTDTGEETTPTDEEPQPDEGDDGTSRGTPRQLEQAVESCKENVAQAPQLSRDAKADLEELCEQAATGDPEDLREVSRKVCERIIEDTLPAGEQREQALKLCEQSGER